MSLHPIIISQRPPNHYHSLRAGMFLPTNEISFFMGGMPIVYNFAFSPLLLLREKEQLLS